MDAAARPNFQQILEAHGLSLRRERLETVQVNLGKLCNQTCVHCHVDAGPTRTRENMDARTAQRVLDLIRRTPGLVTVDLTGGAPELNPHFRDMVVTCRGLGLQVIDRCNLTVLFEPGQQDLADFLAQHKVRIVASLPCYSSSNVEAQRGQGVFAKSISALQQLCALGYGRDPELILDLVYNPAGAFLPPPQHELEAEYRRRLAQDFGICFTHLLALTNLPVKRFAAFLKQRGELGQYYDLLVQSFNPRAVDHVMCRKLVSISWDGKLYDCDFNQMEKLSPSGASRDIWSVDSLAVGGGKSAERNCGRAPSAEHPAGGLGLDIRTAPHCFGCTAGQGSSCGGAVVAAP